MRSIQLAAVALATTLMAATVPAFGQDPPPDPEPAPGTASRISLDVKEQPLADVVKYIATVTGKNLLLGRNPEGKPLGEVWPPLEVTVQFDAVPWEHALRLVCESVDCRVEREGDVWTINQPPTVTIEMERADLRDVVQAIAAISGASILVDISVPDELPVSIRVRNVPWDDALKSVIASTGMVLARADTKSEIWVVKYPDALRKIPPPRFAEGERGEDPEQWEPRRLTLSVQDAPLGEVIAYIARNSWWPIELHDFATDDAPPLRVTARFEDRPWREVLADVAKVSGCLVREEDHGFVVYRSRHVTLQAREERLEDLLARLVPEFYTVITLGPHVPKDATVSINLRAMPVPDAVRAVCAAADCVPIERPQKQAPSHWLVRSLAELRKNPERLTVDVSEFLPMTVTVAGARHVTLPVPVDGGMRDLIELARERLTRGPNGEVEGSVTYDAKAKVLTAEGLPSALAAIDRLVDGLLRTSTFRARDRLRRAEAELADAERLIRRLKRHLGAAKERLHKR